MTVANSSKMFKVLLADLLNFELANNEKLCQKLKKYEKVCQKLKKVEKVCQKQRRYEKVC